MSSPWKLDRCIPVWAAAFVTGEMQDVVEMGLYSGEGREPVATAATVSLEGKILHASGLWPAGKRTGEQAR